MNGQRENGARIEQNNEQNNNSIAASIENMSVDENTSDYANGELNIVYLKCFFVYHVCQSQRTCSCVRLHQHTLHAQSIVLRVNSTHSIFYSHLKQLDVDENAQQNDVPHDDVGEQAENNTANGACNDENNDSVAVSVADKPIDEHSEFV